MKKFVKKLIILLLAVSAITFLVNALYLKKLGPDFENTDKFNEVPENIEICNFGSSHGLCGFNYEDVSERYSTFNFALLSQYLSYDYRIFENYKSHISEGAVVFIPISYFSLLGKDETDVSDFTSKNRRYYSFLPAYLIKEYDMETDVFMRFLPVMTVDPGTLFKALRGKTKQDYNDTEWQKTAISMDVAENAHAAYMRHVGYQYVDGGSLLVNENEIKALYDLINGCREIGAVPVLLTVPYTREYTDEMKNAEGFYEWFYSFMDKVTEDTGTEFYDYAFDERFSDKHEWFMNADHLNKEGAGNFTDILIDEVLKERMGLL